MRGTESAPLYNWLKPGEAAPPTSDLAPKPSLDAPFVFTGSGAEYFRIWIINVVLTIVTLGIYSAWAKVRKASYFARNTRLLGDSFEFTANPWAILRGRLLALVLLGFYTFAFEFSLTIGLVATAALLATAPLLFASATRFRLRNTRWRALRFDFTASGADAYRTALIVIALWISSTVFGALGGLMSGAIAAGVAGLLLPWMHHRMKAFQHRHVWFAGNASQFRSALGRFYLTYLIAGVSLFLAGVVAAIAGGALAVALSRSGNARVIGTIIGLAAGALGYLATWPYFASRIQRIVWERTTLGPFSFTTRSLFRALGGAALAGLLWGDYSSVASHAAILFGQLDYSRSDETEADEFAIAALRRAGISPAALARFFWKIESRASGQHDVPGWASTHPDSGSRAKHAEEAADADDEAAASAPSR